MLRSPHSLGECGVSLVNQASQFPKPARTFFIHKHTAKEKKARPLSPQAFSSLQQEQEQEQEPKQGSQRSAQAQMELLEKLTSGREKGKSDLDKITIAEQLSSKVMVNADDEAVVPLGKQIPQEYDDLTVSQKRNIRRQKYLDEVSKRNDAPFFATIALFVILPPAVILGIAVATGYVNFLP